MTPERWHQIDKLLDEALNLPADERSRFLVKACGEDTELLAHLQGVLKARDQSGFRNEPALNVLAKKIPTPSAERSRRDRSASLAGATVLHYQLIEPVGSGGMGVVYRAIDTKLNRPVAIKFLSEDLADATARRRFQREAQTASSLNHPHILTVYDVGEFEGRQYLVTEFVDGGTLKDWVKSEKRTWRQCVELLIGVADGLAAAHAAGILHRDIKPANILVAKNGYAKLADFGLAKLVERPSETSVTLTEGPTRPGFIVGTIAYMSPEQASGGPLDARSDIFSFGVVLYELLAGRRPFAAPTDLELLKTIIDANPDPLFSDLPIGLRMAVEKALEKDPDVRYQSMRELVVDLKRLQRRLLFPPREQAHRPPRNRWGFTALGTGVLLLISAGIIWRLWQQDYFWKNPLERATIERLTDFEGDEAEPAISPDGKFAVFASVDRDGREDIVITQVGSGEFVNLTKGQFRLGMAGGRSLRISGFSNNGTQIWFDRNTGPNHFEAYLVPPTGGTPRVFLEDATSLDWSPDGSRIVHHVTGRPGDPLVIVNRDGTQARPIFQEGPGTHHHYPIWSPDGRFIYFVKGNPFDSADIWRIAAADATQPAAPERITHHNTLVSHPAWLDSRTLVYTATAEDGTGRWLYAVDVEHRIPHRVRSGIAEQYVAVAASAGRPRRLVAEVATRTASLWTVPLSDRLQTEADVQPFAVRNARALAPRFASGQVLFLSSPGGRDALWKLEKDVATELWSSSESGVIAPPAVSPDGSRICIAYRKRGRGGLYVMNANGANVRALAESELFDVRSGPSWSPDGKQVAVTADAGEGMRVFKVPVDGGPPVQLVKTLSLNPEWSPDDSFILYLEQQLGVAFKLKAVRPDGLPFPIPDIDFQSVAAPPPNRLISGGKAAITLEVINRSPTTAVEGFVMVDLSTGQKRQLTEWRMGSGVQNFDISPDGKQIIFDRVRLNSDIVMMELP